MACVATPGIRQGADPREWRDHRFGLPAERWASLRGRNFWITGAGTGYGQAIAVALAVAGGQVFLSGRRREKLVETRDMAAGFGAAPDLCVPVSFDMRSESETQAAAQQVDAACGALHGLINNAALPNPAAGRWALSDCNSDQWEDLLRTNVTGPWQVTRAALPSMVRGGGGRLLFMTSEAGWADTAGFGPYNLSKAALNSLGASWARELAARYPNCDFQVNTLIPGEARSEMNQGCDISPFAVVSMTLALLSHPAGGPNGRFFHRDGRHFAFAYADAHPRPLL